MTEGELKEKVAKAMRENAEKPSGGKRHAAAMSITGDHNVQVGGDININHKTVEVMPPAPRGPEHITDAQAFKLQELVAEAVKIDCLAGADRGKAFPRWWGKLKAKYKVPRYDLIPCHLGDEAISFLQQEIAKLFPKVRRRDNATWRKKHYEGIYARSRELGRDKAWVYDLVEQRIGKKVTSLTQLGEQDLDKLYHIIMAMK
jgi:hypothetical protein